MPKDHRPDTLERWKKINQEDLTAPKPLLIFLNSRGLMKPWEFAAIKMEFSPVLKMLFNGCVDQNLCISLTIDFTKAVDPSVYERLNRSSDGSLKRHRYDGKYSVCARRAFQTLLMQQRILSFLRTCARAILHDKTDIDLLQSPIQDVLPITEIVNDHCNKHTSFTKVLNLAPYRGWNSLNFSQLRCYIKSTFTKHKSHIWALREDPGYFADNVQEQLSHLPIKVPSDCSCHLVPYQQLPEFMTHMVSITVHESYWMLNDWNFLRERLDMFEGLLRGDVETDKVDGCGCKVTIEDREGIDFCMWNKVLQQDFNPPLNSFFPLKEKLNYLEYKSRTPNTTNAMREAEQNLDCFWAAVDAHYKSKTGLAQHQVIKDCLLGNDKMYRTAPWDDNVVEPVKPAETTSQEYRPISNLLHDKALQTTGAFDRLSMTDKVKLKTRGVADPEPEVMENYTVKPPDPVTLNTKRTFRVEKRTYKVFRALLSAPSDGMREVSKSIKWIEFRRAMGSIGFSIEKLQGSAWQFTPGPGLGSERSIQFHELHPENEITHVIAKRMGRRLGRVYGWCGEMFQLE